MSNLKIYHNTWALQQLPVTLKLFSTEWRFLICSDGKTPVDQIQRRLGLSTAEVDTIIKRLSDIGVLAESTVSLEDHARATVDQPLADQEPQTFVSYLAAVEASSAKKTAGPAPASASNNTAPPAVAAPAPSTPTPPPAREKPVPTFSPLQKPSPPSPPMSLQAVIQFILNHKADPTSGQLATYQVFMNISTSLLKRNGITSLRFQDDRMITDPELQTALLESIRKVLNVSCSPEMLAAAPATAVA